MLQSNKSAKRSTEEVNSKRSMMYPLLLQFLFSQNVNAGVIAEVEKVRGSAFSDSQQLVKGVAINEDSKIELKEGAVVFLKLKESQSKLRLAGPGSVFVKREKNIETVNLLQGILRILTGHQKNAHDPYQIKTPTAVVGVRGTDFAVSYQPLLSEVEVVVFDGTVQLTSSTNPKDSKTIQKGYWGGLGGRFGKKIGDLINLSKPALDHYDRASSWDN